MCKPGLLKKVNPIEKERNGLILVWFMKLNQKKRRKPFLIPKIKNMLLKLEISTQASSLDLNMGYHYIRLYHGSKHINDIVLLWGKYE